MSNFKYALDQTTDSAKEWLDQFEENPSTFEEKLSVQFSNLHEVLIGIRSLLEDNVVMDEETDYWLEELESCLIAVKRIRLMRDIPYYVGGKYV